jgi:hypothetical protein
MSIITKFQSDMDQILSNFVPYTNPYIILSWRVPEEIVSNGFAFPQEIRSEVLWDGNITMGYPTDIAANENEIDIIAISYEPNASTPAKRHFV